MKQINRHLKTTFIFSTHDQKVIDQADRLVKIEDGYITAFGVRDDVGKTWNMAKIRTLPEPPDDPLPELPHSHSMILNSSPIAGTKQS